MNPRVRHVALGAALVGAVLLVAFGDRSPDSEVAEAVERPARPAAPAVAVPAAAPAAAAAPAPARPAADGADGATPAQQILALVPRDTLIGDSDARFGAGDNGPGPFGRQDWTPPPPPPPPPAAPPPPVAPALPFSFIGKSVGDGIWEVYLARGERTYVVHDKDVIDGTWRVEAIAPPVMTLTYLPLNQVQQLNIGVFD
ncbi:hypothetical protein QPK32_04965 [Massilia sp. YIM B02763]|uniref:hypothetical protein n=1 Tax=Massilia sp. YIM B02763 TaxID=3050130 RepID=UPI0025B6A0CF|nr:hypothetical protein [Massilia sp. YIM B02763]